MRGLSEEPGRRYSGGAPSWLAVSVFVLLKERFRFFPLGELESAAGIERFKRFQRELNLISLN